MLSKLKERKVGDLPKPGLLNKFEKHKFLLTIGDEGAILLYMKGRQVLRRLFAASADPKDRRIFEELFRVDPHSPIHILIDVMDQSYTQQTLPPVSPLSVSKLIKRRLERDFPKDDIKGALQLGRSKEGRKDWNYLFVSVANVPPVAPWLEFLLDLPNRIKGIYMLPIESQNFVSALQTALHKQTDTTPPSEWQLLVSHNKVGGFRQVVLKGGSLVFTRLAQPIGEAIPEVIAGNIEQEIQNTIEYLKRLSFREDAGLDVYIIVADVIKKVLDISNLPARGKHILTPFEAANALQLEEAAKEQDHYGDVVLAASFGATRKSVLHLSTEPIQKMDLFYDTSNMVRIASYVFTPLALLYFGIMWYEIYHLNQDITFSEGEKQQAAAKLASTQKKTKELPHDIDKITDVVALYELFSGGPRSPLPLIARFGETLENDILVRSLRWNVTDFIKAQENGKPQEVTSVFDVGFPNKERNLDTFLNLADTYFRKLQKQFEADYSVAYSKLPGRVGENEVLEVTFGEEKPKDSQLASDTISVEVTLKGPIAPPEETASKSKPKRRR